MTDPVRRLSEEEVAFYTEHGWLHAPGLVSGELVERLSAKAHELHRPSGAVSVSAVAQAFGQNRGLAEVDADFAQPVFSPVMADNAARLMPGHPQVRLQINNLLIKEPAGGTARCHDVPPGLPLVPHGPGDHAHRLDGAGRHPGRHGLAALLRSLAPLRPARALVRPRRRRHGRAAPVVGRAGALAAAASQARRRDHPHRADRPRRRAQRHSSPRLSFAWTYFDASTLYTGSPYKQTDDLGLKINEVFDHAEFPIVSRA